MFQKKFGRNGNWLVNTFFTYTLLNEELSLINASGFSTVSPFDSRELLSIIITCFDIYR